MALPVELQFLNTRKGQGGLATLLSLAFATTFLVLFLDLPEEAHTMNSTTAALKMKLSSIPDAPSSHGHFIQIHRIKKPAIILSYFPSSDSHNDFYETLRLQGRFAAAARGMEVYKFNCEMPNAYCHDIKKNDRVPELKYVQRSDDFQVHFEHPEDDEFRMARLTKWLDECPQLHDKARYQQPIHKKWGPNKKTHPHMFHPSGELDHDWESKYANHEWKQGKDGVHRPVIPGQEEEDDDDEEDEDDEYKEEI